MCQLTYKQRGLHELTGLCVLVLSLPVVQDGEVRKAFQRSLTKQGFKFKLGTKVNGATIENNKVKLDLEPAKGGDKEVFEADVVLVSAGSLAQLHAYAFLNAGSLLALRPVSHRMTAL